MDKDSLFSNASAPAGTQFHPPPENPPPYYVSPQSTAPPQQYGGYPPYAQPQYPYPQQQQTHTVIQIVSPLPGFGSRPAHTRCPFCQEDVVTLTTRRFTSGTHMCACVLCFMCMPCFSWIPYVTDCMNDIEHDCPNCGKFLGIFTRPSGGRRY